MSHDPPSGPIDLGKFACSNGSAASLRRVARQVLRSPDDADDAVQNAALRMLRLMADGYRVRSITRLWCAMVRNEAASIHRANCRRLRRVELAVDDDLEARTGGEFGAAAAGDALMSVIATNLPPAARRWWADLLTDMTDDEVARRDGVSTAAVRQRRCRLEGMVRAAISRVESNLAPSRTGATGFPSNGS